MTKDLRPKDYFEDRAAREMTHGTYWCRGRPKVRPSSYPALGRK